MSFLTMLERDVSEANGNVRRMLSVCAEFERIARVALDKAEREMRGRGKRKQAERERDKALKERISGEVAQGLEEGKSLEQMQVETQAAYRRPVQTPSLRASIAGSQAGSQTGNSPASWGHSPPGGTGPEYQRSTSNTRPPNGQNPQAYMPSQPPFNPAAFPMPNGMDTHFAGTPPQPPPFSAPPPMGPDGNNFQSTGFSPQGAEFPMGPFTGPPNDMSAAGAGAFQQPFVPQDLWTAAMTFEWDWAEGLGLGSFTPGPGFDASAASGGFPDMNAGAHHGMGAPQ